MARQRRQSGFRSSREDLYPGRDVCRDGVRACSDVSRGLHEGCGVADHIGIGCCGVGGNDAHRLLLRLQATTSVGARGCLLLLTAGQEIPDEEGEAGARGHRDCGMRERVCMLVAGSSIICFCLYL